MRHINAQDGFYSQDLGRFVYHDNAPMGDIFSDIGNSISNAANTALNSLTNQGQNLAAQAGAAANASAQSGLSKLWQTFFGTPTGQAVQASGVKGYFSDYLPASVAAKYNKNPALYNGLAALGLGVIVYMAIPKKHKKSIPSTLAAAPSTVINLVAEIPKAAAEAAGKVADAVMPSVPAASAATAKANPVLSLMGYANARPARRRRRKARKARKAR